MSENNMTDNLLGSDIAESEDAAKTETSAQTGDDVTSVFSAQSSGSLGGTELIGNFDDLLKSLGITPITQMDSGEVYSDDGFEEIKLTIPKQEDEYVPFSDDTYLEKHEKDSKEKQQRKKFMQNFRVLSKKTSDRTILEAAPTGEGKGNVADNVKPEEGEDIFEAVEKAESRKKRGIFHAKGKSAHRMLDKANKKKKEEVLVKAKELSAALQTKMSHQKVQMIALCALGFVMIVFSFLPMFNSEEANPLSFLFNNGGRNYGILNIAFLLITAGIGYDRLYEAFKTIRTVKLSSNTGLFILFVFVLIHQVVMLATGKSATAGINLYNIYAIFAVLVSVLSENIKAKIALMNIAVVVRSGVIETVHTVDNKADSDVLTRGVSNKGTALYCAQADTIRGLNGNLGVRPNETKFYTFLHIGVVVASIIAGTVIMIRSKDATMFLTAITACLCLCGPSLCEFARTYFLFRENKKLASLGAAVTAFDGIKTMEKASCVAMDASDLFTAQVQKFKAVRMSRMSVQNSATLTAALLKDTGSLLAQCFEGYEETIDGDLPAADDLEFEPRKGYKAMIAGREVMVGNRNMLIKHEIEVPSKKEERAYAGSKNCMYVVVDGELTATFLVSYNLIPSLRKSVASFSKTNLVLLLTTTDPSITESLVALKLGADISAVKIVGTTASELMDEYRLNRSMRQSNSLVCSKYKKGIFNLVVGAKLLCENDKFVLLMHVAGQCLAFAMLLAAVIVGVPAFFNPYIIILLQVVWSAISVLLASKR